MASNLFDPPPIYNLPLVKGQDLIVDFKRKVPDSNPTEYLDYDVGTTVSLIIDTETPTVAAAVITGHNAVCRIESTTSDAIPQGLLWRCVVSLAGTPTTERVPTNGVIKRYDGKPPR